MNRWYLYPYTGVDNGWLAAGILLITAVTVALRTYRSNTPLNAAQRLDTTTASHGLYAAYFAYAERHRSSDDFLCVSLEAALADPPPASVVSWRREAGIALLSLILLATLIGAAHFLPPPPEEVDESPFTQEPLPLHRTLPPNASPFAGAQFRHPQGASVGLDISSAPIPDDLLDKLRDTGSVGGLDDKGKPKDFYTGYPEQDWRYLHKERLATAGEGLRSENKALHIPVELSKQLIPERYRGAWR